MGLIIVFDEARAAVVTLLRSSPRPSKAISQIPFINTRAYCGDSTRAGDLESHGRLRH